MRTLIVEDDFTSRTLLKKILSPLGECDIAVNGAEAVESFRLAHLERRPYDLVCMDIMMPGMDGHEALKIIRGMEKEIGVRGARETAVIMTTALDDPKNVVEAYYKGGATSYISKPIDKRTLLNMIKGLGVLK